MFFLFLEKLQNSQPQMQQRHKTINYEKLIKEVKEMRYQHLIDQTGDLLKNGSKASIETSDEFSQSELSKIDFTSFPVQHDFPTILAEKSQLEPKCSDIFRQNPFIINRDLTVNIVNTASNDVSIKTIFRSRLFFFFFFQMMIYFRFGNLSTEFSTFFSTN